MTMDAIVSQWQSEIEATYECMSQPVRQARKKFKDNQPLKVWLGSPRSGPLLSSHGELLKKLLATEGCDVALSTVASGNYAAEAEPAELAKAFDLLFLIAASAGTSAEAMELALWQETKSKLHVFLPHEFKAGYLAKSLGDRHKLLCDLSFFSLEGAQAFNAELPKKMISTVVKYRNYCIQTKLQFPTITQTTNIIMGDNIQATNSTIINRSTVDNAFNKVKKVYGESTAEALKLISEHIESSGNKEAGEFLDVFNEELAKAKPRQSILKNMWDKICKSVPTVLEIANVGVEIAKLCSGNAADK